MHYMGNAIEFGGLTGLSFSIIALIFFVIIKHNDFDLITMSDKKYQSKKEKIIEIIKSSIAMLFIIFIFTLGFIYGFKNYRISHYSNHVNVELAQVHIDQTTNDDDETDNSVYTFHSNYGTIVLNKHNANLKTLNKYFGNRQNKYGVLSFEAESNIDHPDKLIKHSIHTKSISVKTKKTKIKNVKKHINYQNLDWINPDNS